MWNLIAAAECAECPRLSFHPLSYIDREKNIYVRTVEN